MASEQNSRDKDRFSLYARADAIAAFNAAADALMKTAALRDRERHVAISALLSTAAQHADEATAIVLKQQREELTARLQHLGETTGDA